MQSWGADLPAPTMTNFRFAKSATGRPIARTAPSNPASPTQAVPCIVEAVNDCKLMRDRSNMAVVLLNQALLKFFKTVSIFQATQAKNALVA
jgi:hypothetical protein